MGPSFSLTDTGGAQRLVAMFGQRIRYCPQAGWFLWDGRRWQPDARERIVLLVQKMAESIYQEAASIIATASTMEPGAEKQQRTEMGETLSQYARSCESRGRVDSIIALAQAQALINLSALDSHPMLLTTLNGTLDLTTGLLHSSHPGHYLTKCIPVEWDSKAECPQWLAFLDRIMGKDQTLVDFLQRAIGYTLTGETREQCLFLFYGEGANGKTTLLEILLKLLGDYGKPVATSMILQNPRGDSTGEYHLAGLVGRRFVKADELSADGRLMAPLVKLITGSDTIPARHPAGRPFDFAPTFKLFLATNHKPVITDSSHGMWRRIRVVPFLATIPDKEQDKLLPLKLQAELPGILRWAVEGCLRWQESGLGLPLMVELGTKHYRTEQDVFSQFVADRCELSPAKLIPRTVLYSAYTGWAAEEEAPALSGRVFARRLAELGVVKGPEGTEGRTWRGIGLKPSPLESPTLVPLPAQVPISSIEN